jgi:hypothetical protein
MHLNITSLLHDQSCAKSLKTEDVIIYYLVRTIAHLKGLVIGEYGGMEEL